MPAQCLVGHLRLSAKIESNGDARLIAGIRRRIVHHACLANKGQQARLIRNLDDVSVVEFLAGTGARRRHRQMPVHEKVVRMLVQMAVAP